MDSGIIKGNEFMEIGIRDLCDSNNIDYNNDFEISNIKYNKDINKNFQYKIIRGITYDGTIIFVKHVITEIFYDLLYCKTIYKPLVDNIDLSSIKGINYIIGDLEIKKEKVTKISDNKEFTVNQEIFFKLPVYCELIINQ